MAEVRHENLDNYSAAFPSSLAKKGEKHSYYCNLCLVELNSDETMMAHKEGQKHLKKQNLTKKQCIEEGKIMASDTSYIHPISAAKSAPKKLPILLKEKLSETSKPVVGLKFIYEVISYSNIEMEPHYECKLCSNQGKGTIHPGLRLVPSWNFFLFFDRSNHILLEKSQNLICNLSTMIQT
jgi:hypothetical protein